MNTSVPYRSIADYALLSDCHSSALVSSAGSIDWACLRRFDAGSVFARLLDHERGGFFAITPTDATTSSSRRYVDDTMVLETTLTVASGVIRISDAFAMREGGADRPINGLIRRVECIEGDVSVDIEIEPRFEYGSARPWLRHHTPRVLSAIAGDDALVIHTDVELTIDRRGCALAGSHRLRDGDSFSIVLLSQAPHQLDVDSIPDPDSLLADTIRWWVDWSAATVADGRYASMLRRSALVLKGLSCAPTGAIIAAPTTSLPEITGGTANWDYRYCWIRDATLTLSALSSVGHHEVAAGFRTFLMRSSAGRGEDLQIMYGPYGERRLAEFEIDLCGWRNSSPVRVGNRAAHQTQLDVYGHVLTAVHLWHTEHEDIDADEWAFLASLVDIACHRSREPDAGIWEIRGEQHHYVHSKVMLWAAIGCGIALATHDGFDGVDLAHWTATRDEIRQTVEVDGFDATTGSFVQRFGSTAVDASLLQLAIVGFVRPDDPRMQSTVGRIEAELCTEDGFAHRYGAGTETVDGGSEGVFLLCSCWLVQVLAMQGHIERARTLLDRVVSLANDVGLLAEEFSPTTGEMLGNFPQAFTHLGLIAAIRAVEAGEAGE